MTDRRNTSTDLPPGKSPSTHQIGIWVGTKRDADVVLPLPGMELQFLDRPARKVIYI